MNTKKNVLRISSVYIFYFVVLLFVSATCDGSNWCNVQEDSIFGLILFSFAPLSFLFLLSIITYKMRDEVFHAWWRFALWWVPVIIIVTLLLQNAGGGGTLGMDKDFTIFILIILYAILAIVSLYRILRAYFLAKGSW